MSLRRILHISVLVMWIFTISGCAGSFRPNEKEAKLRWGLTPYSLPGLDNRPVMWQDIPLKTTACYR